MLYEVITIEKGAVVKDSIIMPGSHIKSGTIVEYAIVGEDCVIEENVIVGERPENFEDKSEWGIAVIGHNVSISSGTKIFPKQIVSENI